MTGAVVVLYLTSFAIMGTNGYGFVMAHNNMLLSTFYDNFIPLTAFFAAAFAVTVYQLTNAVKKKALLTPRITGLRALLIFNVFISAFAAVIFVVMSHL